MVKVLHEFKITIVAHQLQSLPSSIHSNSQPALLHPYRSHGIMTVRSRSQSSWTSDLTTVRTAVSAKGHMIKDLNSRALSRSEGYRPRKSDERVYSTVPPVLCFYLPIWTGTSASIYKNKILCLFRNLEDCMSLAEIIASWGR
jgi:hypothetical protein